MRIFSNYDVNTPSACIVSTERLTGLLKDHSVASKGCAKAKYYNEKVVFNDSNGFEKFGSGFMKTCLFLSKLRYDKCLKSDSYVYRFKIINTPRTNYQVFNHHYIKLFTSEQMVIL